MANFSSFYKALELQQKITQLATLAGAFSVPQDTISKFWQATAKHQKFLDSFISPSSKLIQDYQRTLDKFSVYSNTTFTVLDRLKRLSDGFRDSPELAFITIADLEILSLKSTEELLDAIKNDQVDEALQDKEELLEEFLVPHLEALGLKTPWDGANFALASNENPDRLRHTLVSLRTLLEHLIDGVLAPNLELSTSEMFSKEFKDFHLGKKKLEKVKISRTKRLKYISSKFEFRVLEGFTEQDIAFICKCYSTLCKLHSLDVQMTENQVRILRVKTGITVWLLAYIKEASLAERN